MTIENEEISMWLEGTFEVGWVLNVLKDLFICTQRGALLVKRSTQRGD